MAKLKTNFEEEDEQNMESASADGSLNELVVYILICLNTEDELSYIDRILYECEFKIKASDYLDQREK